MIRMLFIVVIGLGCLALGLAILLAPYFNSIAQAIELLS